MLKKDIVFLSSFIPFGQNDQERGVNPVKVDANDNNSKSTVYFLFK